MVKNFLVIFIDKCQRMNLGLHALSVHQMNHQMNGTRIIKYLFHFLEEKIRRETLAEEQRIEKGKIICLHGNFWLT